jgi:hypothetical protein
VENEYSSEYIEENLQTELITEQYSDIEGQLLAVSTSTLDNRRVDYFIRIFNGKLQERQDFYDDGRLFHSVDWISFDELYLSDGKVKFSGDGESGEGIDPPEWAKRYAKDWLYEYTTEIWAENKDKYDKENN